MKIEKFMVEKFGNWVSTRSMNPLLILSLFGIACWSYVFVKAAGRVIAKEVKKEFDKK